MLHKTTLLALLLASTTLGCKSKDQPASKTANSQAAKAKVTAPEPIREPLQGAGKLPTIILSQAWFWKNAEGRPKPGPARLQIWRKTAEGWKASLMEDPDSNVFHKTILMDDGSLLTIGAEKANLKRWTYANGEWSDSLLWTKSWGGKFNRLRDLEIGDVDGDGEDEYVMATHDGGVVAVYNPPKDGAEAQVIEIDAKPDTFVHEIEICDIDGDGKNEFFATPSDRNKANASQEGHVQMFRWDGSQYVSTTVDPMGATHAKEILCTDVDGDGKGELFAVIEAETGPNKEVVKPVEVRRYTLQADGSFTHESIATIDDRQTRFLVPGDFDGDGKIELVAAAMKTGLYLLHQGDEGWTESRIDEVSSGFEHATYAADLDGDGTLELYVAADDQRELKRYTWNADKKAFDKQLLGRLKESTITWNIEVGEL